MKNENFGFCPYCGQHKLLFTIYHKKREMLLLLCEECAEDYENNLPPKIISETRYHEMAKNLAKVEG